MRIADGIGRDVLLAGRMLRKSPVFTIVAIFTLTLSIGANTAVFSLMNELMLKSVPVPNAKRLVILRIQPDKLGYTFNYPLFQALEEHSHGVMQAFAFSDRSFNLRTNDGLEAIAGEFVSGEYFAGLGVKARIGRCIEPRDDRPGAPNGMIAVVSNRFWRNRMAGDTRALGQKITVNERVFTLVGVLPDGFKGMSRDRMPEVFLPLELEPVVDAPFNLVAAGYRAWWLSAGGALNQRVSLQQANAYLRVNSHQFFEAAPPGISLGPNGRKLTDLHVMAERGANGLSSLRLRFRKPLEVLMGLVATVLLIGCLNLAILLAVRAASRTREITTRFALGASRVRLVRQLLTESLLLALIGAALGLAVAPALTHFIEAVLTPRRGPVLTVLQAKPDATVYAFTALLAILATTLAGTMPAIRSTGREFQTLIKESSNSLRGADRRHSWRRLLLAVEVALSLMLATGASLLGYSLVQLHHTRLGFDPHGLIFLVPEGKQPVVGRRLMLAYKELIGEIQSLPGVSDVSISAAVPMNSGYINDRIQATGGPKYQFQQNAVGPNYFKSLRTPLLDGREFNWTDADGAARKAILNSSAARSLFPEGRTVGKYVILEDGRTTAEVIGVVADSKYSNVRDADPPMVYSAAMQSLIPGASLSVLIRTKRAITPLVTAARKIIARAIPDVPLPAAVSMEDTIAESLATERVMSTLALFFGGLSLLITGIGLYGTLAYSTERRTGEIGIRLAVGAQRKDIVSMVCAENGWITVLGCLAGVAGSLLATRAIASLLYGVSAHDPIVFGTAIGMLACVAVAASLFPAIKASRIDPISAIRYE